MTTQRRGFTKERHGALKLALSCVALAGFGLGWAGFANSHPSSAEDESSPLPEPTATTANLPTAPARTIVVISEGTVATGDPPEPAATRTPRRSRGS